MKSLLLILLFTTAPAAFPFDWNLHRSITARALSPLGFSTTAIDQIADANITIDKNEGSNPALHVDNESFEPATVLMRSRLNKAAVSVMNGDIKSARITFGYLSHTVQDFYAHTNYVEFMPGQTVDLLHLTNPGVSVACSKINMKGGLTSGYYPDTKTPANKCSHTLLNKDSGNGMAEKYAETATAEMSGLLEKEVYSLSADPQKAAELLALFKGEAQLTNFDNQDIVAFTSYNETFKLIPFIGLTRYNNNYFSLESRYTAGLKIESRINDRFVTGFGLTHNSMTIKDHTLTEYEYSSYGADLFGKFYFISVSRFQPYTGAGIGYVNSTLNKSSTNNFNGELITGVDLMYARKTGANVELKYMKPLSDSSSFAETQNERLARKIKNSSFLELSIGLILSF